MTCWEAKTSMCNAKNRVPTLVLSATFVFWPFSMPNGCTCIEMYWHYVIVGPSQRFFGWENGWLHLDWKWSWNSTTKCLVQLYKEGIKPYSNATVRCLGKPRVCGYIKIVLSIAISVAQRQQSFWNFKLHGLVIGLVIGLVKLLKWSTQAGFSDTTTSCIIMFMQGM